MKLTDTLSKSKTRTSCFWVALGFGPSVTIEDEMPYALCAILNGEYLHHFFSARIIYAAGNPRIDYYAGNQVILPYEENFDTGVLYGYGAHNSLWFFNAAIGLAYTSVTKKKFYVKPGIPYDVFRVEASYGIGLPWQIQIFSKFTKYSAFGMGLSICGNVNKFQSFLNIIYALEVGLY